MRVSSEKGDVVGGNDGNSCEYGRITENKVP
jgi:hypothetical protein